MYKQESDHDTLMPPIMYKTSIAHVSKYNSTIAETTPKGGGTCYREYQPNKTKPNKGIQEEY